MHLLCVDFTEVDILKDGKENILVLIDAFTKFRQTFITPNQKAITIAKVLVENGLMCMVFLHLYTAIKARVLIMRL